MSNRKDYEVFELPLEVEKIVRRCPDIRQQLEEGNPNAYYVVGLAAHMNGDRTIGLKYFEKSASLGFTVAQQVIDGEISIDSAVKLVKEKGEDFYRIFDKDKKASWLEELIAGILSIGTAIGPIVLTWKNLENL